MKIWKRMVKCVIALLCLMGIMSGNNSTNRYALAASGSRRTKRAVKTKKKHPKQLPKLQRNANNRPAPKKKNVHQFKQYYQREQAAKRWIIHVESRGQWNVRSYGSNCIGKYQLRPAYLGYVHGHVNLNHKHQDAVAERYVQKRYGSWQAAKQFHIEHGWY